MLWESWKIQVTGVNSVEVLNQSRGFTHDGSTKSSSTLDRSESFRFVYAIAKIACHSEEESFTWISFISTKKVNQKLLRSSVLLDFVLPSWVKPRLCQTVTNRVRFSCVGRFSAFFLWRFLPKFIKCNRKSSIELPKNQTACPAIVVVVVFFLTEKNELDENSWFSTRESDYLLSQQTGTMYKVHPGTSRRLVWPVEPRLDC